MRTIKILVVMMTAVLMLSGCAAPGAAEQTTPTEDDQAAQLQAQVDTLSGKIEQLQQRIDDLETENEQLQNDSNECAVDDLTYMLDQITQSGTMLTSFPALITGMESSGDGYTLHIDRQVINPDYEPGVPGDETYLIDDGEGPEDIFAGPFTYVNYSSYLMPELDENFADYISGSDGGAAFTVYMAGDQVIFLDEITVP